MSSDVDATPILFERFATRGIRLGFPIPPVAVRVKLLEGAGFWTLFVQPIVPGAALGLTAWVEAFAPVRLEFGSRGVVRADFAPLPPVWAHAFREVELDLLTIDAQGEALVSARGGHEALVAFARRLADGRVDLRRLGIEPSAARLLTFPQEEALRAAVDAGYYQIPRPVNLKELAKRLTVSSASLSERLRRAEGRVITLYVQHGGRTPWDESTLFDARPPAREPVLWPLDAPLVRRDRAPRARP